MTQLCCPGCRLRFTRAAATYIVACPTCGAAPLPAASAAQALGFRLFSPDDDIGRLPEAIAVAMRRPRPGADPS
jgi:hypothetical protein